jgi:hypothetical protein
MPVSAGTYQVVQHGNTGQIFSVFGPWRREYVSVSGSTAAQQIARDITEGAIDRRPGAPAQLLGSDSVHFLESKELV